VHVYNIIMPVQCLMEYYDFHINGTEWH